MISLFISHHYIGGPKKCQSRIRLLFENAKKSFCLCRSFEYSSCRLILCYNVFLSPATLTLFCENNCEVSSLLFRKTLLVPISSCGIMICASIKKSTIMFFCSSLWSLTCSSATAQRGHLKPSQLRSRIASAFLFSLAVKRLLPSVSSIFWYFTPICIDRSSRDSFILSPTVPLLPRFISFSLSLLSFLSLNKLVKNKQSHFPESFISTSCSFLVPQYTWQNSIFW